MLCPTKQNEWTNEFNRGGWLYRQERAKGGRNQQKADGSLQKHPVQD